MADRVVHHRVEHHTHKQHTKYTMDDTIFIRYGLQSCFFIFFSILLLSISFMILCLACAHTHQNQTVGGNKGKKSTHTHNCDDERQRRRRWRRTEFRHQLNTTSDSFFFRRKNGEIKKSVFCIHYYYHYCYSSSHSLYAILHYLLCSHQILFAIFHTLTASMHLFYFQFGPPPPRPCACARSLHSKTVSKDLQSVACASSTKVIYFPLTVWLKYARTHTRNHKYWNGKKCGRKLRMDDKLFTFNFTT